MIWRPAAEGDGAGALLIVSADRPPSPPFSSLTSRTHRCKPFWASELHSSGFTSTTRDMWDRSESLGRISRRRARSGLFINRLPKPSRGTSLDVRVPRRLRAGRIQVARWSAQAHEGLHIHHAAIRRTRDLPVPKTATMVVGARTQRPASSPPIPSRPIRTRIHTPQMTSTPRAPTRGKETLAPFCHPFRHRQLELRLDRLALLLLRVAH